MGLVSVALASYGLWSSEGVVHGHAPGSDLDQVSAAQASPIVVYVFAESPTKVTVTDTDLPTLFPRYVV